MKLFTWCVFALDPWVCEDSVSVESLGWLDDEKLSDEVLREVRDVVPIWGGEIVSSVLDQFEELLVILFVERWEAAKP